MENEFFQTVKRKRSAAAGLLQGMMILFAVLFLMAGIMLDRGFMLSCFLMAALYYVYRTFSHREYEYLLKGRELRIDRIYGGSVRRTAVLADLDEMVVLAPHNAPEVAPWRKGGSKKAKKMDFTSYQDNISYYTMIVQNDEGTLKILWEPDGEILGYLKRIYPNRVSR